MPKMKKDLEGLYTLSDLARATNTPQNTVWKWQHEGLIDRPSTKIADGVRCYYTPDEYQAMIQRIEKLKGGK